MLRTLALVVLLLAPLAAAYPQPSEAPRFVDSDCLRAHDKRFVYDFVRALGREDAWAIEQDGCTVYQATSAHFVLVTVATTEGEPLESYALHLFEQWGIGRAGIHDGLLLLYVANYTDASGGGPAARVEVGYGLEGVVNSRVAAEAIDRMAEARAESLEAGNLPETAVSYALLVGSAHLLAALADTYDGPGARPAPTTPWWFYAFMALFVLAIVANLYGSMEGRRGRPGWGWRAGSPSWGTGLGRTFSGGMGGGWSGGSFGGGMSGGGGGGGRI